MAAESLCASPGEAAWQGKPVELSEAMVARSPCAAQSIAAGSSEKTAVKLSCVKSSEVVGPSGATAVKPQ